MAADNKSLGRFVLDGIPPAPRGVPQIEVTFDIDSSGILSVSAKDKATSKEQKITIQNATNLSEEEIEKMKKEADLHAKEDEEKRDLAESRNRLDATVFSAEKTLKDLADKVKPEDKAKIEEKVKSAKDLLAKTEIKKDEFDKMSEELGQILQTIGAAMYQQEQSAQQATDQAGAETPDSSDKKKDNKDKKDDQEPEEGEIVK